MAGSGRSADLPLPSRGPLAELLYKRYLKTELDYLTGEQLGRSSSLAIKQQYNIIIIIHTAQSLLL